MVRLLRFLLLGDAHMHKWERVSKGQIIGRTYTSASGSVGDYYNCQCGVCGKMKIFMLKVT